MTKEIRKQKQTLFESKTFHVPIALEEIKDNISIYTNTQTRASKEQIINQAFKFQSQGKIPEAVKLYQDFIDQGFKDHKVFADYGLILKNLGKLQYAEILFRKAIELKPDHPKAYFLLSQNLRKTGEPEEAKEYILKAIDIDPHNANSFLMLGIIFNDLRKLKEGEKAIRKAIKINPNNAEYYYHLITYSTNIKDALLRIKKCLSINENHFHAKIAMGSIQLHMPELKIEGEFPILQQMHDIHSLISNKLPDIFFNRKTLFKKMISNSNNQRPFYEFGVWKGDSFKYLIKYFKEGYGFDTFEGLPVSFNNKKKGTYSTKGVLPDVKGGHFIAGSFENTLPVFFKKERPIASLINFDCEHISSTICALNYCKSVIDNKTLLIFDSFMTNKDFIEIITNFCKENRFSFEIVGISYLTENIVFKFIK